MAAVYAGVHRNGHAVAIKVLHERLSTDADIERLFRREAHLANAIRHPGLVPVIDDDVAEDGCTFLVTPLLVGETVRARAQRTGKKLPLEEVTTIAHSLLQILAAAHAAKIVHRDIKPENLFLTVDGSLRVLDFGIARFFETTEGASVTRSGRAMGTPAFMAPEQALGKIRDIDGRTDIWAVGATMFTLLSGHFVHEAESSSEALVFAATRKPRSIADVVPDLPPPVCSVIDRALAFDKGARWPDANTMAEALARASESVFGLRPPQLPRIAGHLEAPDDIRDATTEHSIPLDVRTPSVIESSPRSSRRDVPLTLVNNAPTPRQKRSRGKWFAIGTLALVLAGSTVATFRVRNAASPPATATGSRSAEQPSTGNPEALTLLRAGLQSWRDGSERAATKSFARALELDPNLAAAHLYLSMIPTWADNETRVHHQAASMHRQQLSPRDLVLLQAYAPAMATPSDLASTEQRLLAAQAAFPSDWMATSELAYTYIRRGDLSKATQLLSDLLKHEPDLGIAWARQGLAWGLLDNPDKSRDSLNECLRISPYGETCLETLMELDANEGRCTDVERHARQALALQAPRPIHALHLAGAIQNRGAAPDSIRAAIAHVAQLAPDSTRELFRLQHETNLSIFLGETTDARRLLDDWKVAVSEARYEGVHGRFAETQIQLALELGERNLATQLAREHLARRDAWLASEYYEDWEIVPLSLEYRAGGLSRTAFQERRDAWLVRQATRPLLVDSLNLRWLSAYAHPAVTSEDAADALRVLPNYLPITDALTRDTSVDQGIGAVYLLAGNPKEALRYLQRAANSCKAIQLPFANTWAHLQLGTAQEQLGNTRAACDAYKVVVNRWGREPHSVSAKAARERRLALRCESRPN